ncbi:hypothetical protein [Desulfonema ishimotonii]|nr:hypothetical protein [Desulfonema ishimotonii]
MKKELEPEDFKILKNEICMTEKFKKLRNSYNLCPNILGSTTVEIYMSDGKNSKAVSVYGYGIELEKIHDRIPYPDKNDKLPDEFRRIFRKLTGLNFIEAEKWTPDYIEIMIWPYGNAPEKSANWPSGWPSLSHPLTRKRGDSYSLYMPGLEKNDLNDFLDNLKPKQAVLINGDKWSVDCRFVFPGEPLWMKAFNKMQ